MALLLSIFLGLGTGDGTGGDSGKAGKSRPAGEILD